jgi:hypothetical protein
LKRIKASTLLSEHLSAAAPSRESMSRESSKASGLKA